MEVHKVILVFVDHDGIGADEAKSVLENARYPNRCMHPEVLEVETRDIGEWDDDHPLNLIDPEMKEWKKLFAPAPQVEREPQPPDVDEEMRIRSRPIPEAARINLEEAMALFRPGEALTIPECLRVWDCLVMAKSFLGEADTGEAG